MNAPALTLATNLAPAPAKPASAPAVTAAPAAPAATSNRPPATNRAIRRATCRATPGTKAASR